MSRGQREYDEIRKKETLSKLRQGFAELKAAHPKTVVTKYQLSKYTGVAKQTINNYEEILKLLEEENKERYKFKTSMGDVIVDGKSGIKDLIKQFETELAKKDDKYKELFKANTQLSLQLVELQDENRKLKSVIERFERKYNGE